MSYNSYNYSELYYYLHHLKEIYNKQEIGFYNDISYTWYYYLFNVFYKSVTYVLYRKNAWA